MKRLIFTFLFFTFTFVLSSRPLIEKVQFDFSRVIMNSVVLVNTDLGIAVGDNGIIRTLTNGCKTSSYFQISEKSNLNKIVKLDDNTFVCVGDNGIIYRTINAGTDWTKINAKTTINLNSISFINKQNGICVGNGGTILRTINGGLDWQEVTGPGTEDLLDITASTNTFYISGKNGTVIKSNDYGISWIKLDVPKIVNYYFISSPGNKLFVMGDSLTVLASEDYGSTFQTPVLDKNYSKVYKRPTIDSYYFFGNDSGFVKVHDMTANSPRDNEYYTIDGGKNWTKYDRTSIVIGARPSEPTCSNFLNPSFGIFLDKSKYVTSAISIYPQMVYKNLQRSNSGEPINLSSTEGKNIALSWTSGALSGLFLSSNAGESWFPSSKFDTIGKERGYIEYSHMTMTDSKTIFLAMNNGKDSTWYEGNNQVTAYLKFGFILKSTDFGQTWTEFNFNHKKGIKNLSFANKDYGIAYFYKKYIVTTDGGNTWSDGIWPDSTIKFIAGMQCPLTNVHIIVGNPDSKTYKMYISKDKGQTWDSTLVLPENCYGIKYLSDNKIFAFGAMKGPNNGYISIIYATSDFGITWDKKVESKESISMFNSDVIREISSYSDKTMCGRDNYGIFLTNDSWANFEEVDLTELEEPESLNDGIFLKENEILLVGDRGSLLKVYTDKVSVQEDLFSNIDFQISPNPATDHINVDLSFLRMQESEIEIYNIFGECVLTVETIHELSLQKIDISSLPEGIYFVRIGEKIGKFVVVR